ncbi:MAG: PAS domain-containing protein [Bacteroidales bacterium]|nr:PAS domain-containing protein [Bacteroidales bacterium]
MEFNKTSIEELNIKIKSLEQQVDFYKKISDTALDWEILRDKEGTILYCNDAFETITGYKKNDLLSGGISEKDIIHPDDWEQTSNALKNLKKEIPVHDLLFRIVKADKSIRYIYQHAQPVYKDNLFYGIRSSARDITEFKLYNDFINTSEKLKLSEKKFKTYILTSPVSIFITDNNAKYQFANPAACKLLGYTLEELTSLSIPDLLAAEDLDAGYKQFIEVRDYGQTHNFETYLKRKDNTNVEVILDAVKVSENEIIAFVKDISDIKNTERQLKEQNKKFKKEKRKAEDYALKLNESQSLAKIGHWEYDIQLDTILWSEQIQKIFEVEKNNSPFNFKNFLDLIHPDDRALVKTNLLNTCLNILHTM